MTGRSRHDRNKRTSSRTQRRQDGRRGMRDTTARRTTSDVPPPQGAGMTGARALRSVAAGVPPLGHGSLPPLPDAPHERQTSAAEAMPAPLPQATSPAVAKTATRVEMTHAAAAQAVANARIEELERELARVSGEGESHHTRTDFFLSDARALTCAALSISAVQPISRPLRRARAWRRR